MAESIGDAGPYAPVSKDWRIHSWIKRCVFTWTNRPPKTGLPA